MAKGLNDKEQPSQTRSRVHPAAVSPTTKGDTAMRLTRIALAAILSLCSVVTTATDLSPDQAQSIWTLAWGQSHSIHKGDSTILFRPPVIHIVNKFQLCALIKKTVEQCGSLQAAQKESQVFLLDTLDFSTVLTASIAFHEMIHYIQWMANGEKSAASCKQFNEWEKQARQMQASVLVKANDMRNAQQVIRQFRPYRCI